MKQESNELFCPIELIEPTALSNEFQLVLSLRVICDNGSSCGVGEFRI